MKHNHHPIPSPESVLGRAANLGHSISLELAEDSIQTVLERPEHWPHVNSYGPNDSRHIVCAAARLAIGWHRTEYRRRNILAREAEQLTRSELFTEAAGHDWQTVQEAIDSLGNNLKEYAILILKGETTRETAKRLGCSHTMVARRRTEALKRLRNILESK